MPGVVSEGPANLWLPDPLTDPNRLRFFLEVHSGLPREGPGNLESTARALAAVGPLPAQPRVLDIACGPGMQTCHLGSLLPDAVITAVEAHAPYVAEAQQRIAAAGFTARVKVMEGDMRALPFAAGSFDLIWCEGAAYIMGVAHAMQAWRELLSEGGRLAFTEAVWLTTEPPAELVDWWLNSYPEMNDVATTLERVSGNGYEVLQHFVLPESAWWDDYYDPMAANIEKLIAGYRKDQVALEVLGDCELEIDYFRRFSNHYGYLFVIAGVL